MPMRIHSLIAILVALPTVGPLCARDPKVPEADSPQEAKPGKVALLTSPKGMRYFLRVPRGYDKDEGGRLIVFLHGSNMNGLTYLESFEEARWCRDDILVCPNGEKGDDPFGANNFTFESAPLVADVTKEVVDAFQPSRVYLGGHSQGGFVTYSAIMHFPELFHGAFPMAADCWMQNEPHLWEDKPEIMAKQKRIAIAVIHGRADPVVSFSQGEHAYEVFLAMGYPKLRLFAPEKLGHQFLLSPVPEALEWLDAMTGRAPDDSIKLAREWAKDKEWGWAHQAALAVLADDDADARAADTARKAVAAVETPAQEAATKMAETLKMEKPETWIPAWLEFRRQFGATKAAAKLVEDYDAARAKERETGASLFRAALAHRRDQQNDEYRRSLQQILSDAPHSFHAYYAWKWLRPAE